jgi:hypothetical protein
MNNLQAILKLAEDSARTVEDPDLRRIAFQEILRYHLGSDEASALKPRQATAAISPRPKVRPAPAPRANSQPAIRPEVAALDLSPDEHGLAPWSTLSVDWKKFCWILEAARLKKVDGMTNAEISHLIDKIFRESKPPEVVNNLKVQIKKGMVKSVVTKSGDREYRVWKILAGGIKEVAAKPVAATQ